MKIVIEVEPAQLARLRELEERNTSLIQEGHRAWDAGNSVRYDEIRLEITYLRLERDMIRSDIVLGVLQAAAAPLSS